MVINKVDLLGTSILLPLSIIEIYVFGLGISLFLSAAYVRFRDINYVWEVLIQAGFYLTPILYPLTFFENPTFQKLILINPMAQAIQTARYGVVSHDPRVVTFTSAWGSPWYLIIPLGIVAAALLFGVWYFRRESKHFAENI
jgi:ABC-2 type transport system permease protein